jgi:hypothetical protein
MTQRIATHYTGEQFAVTDEFIPRSEWDAYMAATASAAGAAWQSGQEFAALSLDTARAHPSFQASLSA